MKARGAQSTLSPSAGCQRQRGGDGSGAALSPRNGQLESPCFRHPEGGGSGQRMIDVGNSLTRLLGSLFVLGAAIGAGTIGVSAFSSAPAGAAPLITVNDASDPTSTLPQANCVASPEGDCTLRAALAMGQHAGRGRHHRPPGSQERSATTPATYYSVNPGVGELQVYETGGVVDLVGAGAAVVDIRAGCPTGCTNDTRVLEIGSGQAGGAVADISGVTISNGNRPCRRRERLRRHLRQRPRKQADAHGLGRWRATRRSRRWRYRAVHGGSATLINDTITGNAVSTVGAEPGRRRGRDHVVQRRHVDGQSDRSDNTTIADNTVDDRRQRQRRRASTSSTRAPGSRPQPDHRHRPLDDQRERDQRQRRAECRRGYRRVRTGVGRWSTRRSAGTRRPAAAAGSWTERRVSSVVSATFDTIAGNTATDAHSGGNLQSRVPARRTSARASSPEGSPTAARRTVSSRVARCIQRVTT